ncbi:cytidine deaminase [Saccharopolyspora sp. NPDC000359]|uniref:cytidine deaminase family protein n=1 Tax=Saccharopolyspora sp. NPDC000359 TaxID=3154251 RepID=UPI0033294DCA
MKPAEIIKTAADCLNPTEQDDRASGSVAAAIVTRHGDVFRGVCIDTACSMGFCAEHAAVAAMVTARQFQIAQVVAVTRDERTNTLMVLRPCGRCREFMQQIDRRNLDAEFVLGPDRVTTLSELLPARDAQAAESPSG